ncbi:hypothetical protein C7M84_007572 [Penaeus vannamei]|uniref:Uncharacterized protein n=1 Tax=Penaeus vannamei TaxID=6689 RepID=A0A3R7M633_PENVA|nr:hypothetical protein C7M84_007572 [Penaeus vannamei]
MPWKRHALARTHQLSARVRELGRGAAERGEDAGDGGARGPAAAHRLRAAAAPADAVLRVQRRDGAALGRLPAAPRRQDGGLHQAHEGGRRRQPLRSADGAALPRALGPRRGAIPAASAAASRLMVHGVGAAVGGESLPRLGMCLAPPHALGCQRRLEMEPWRLSAKPLYKHFYRSFSLRSDMSGTDSPDDLEQREMAVTSGCGMRSAARGRPDAPRSRGSAIRPVGTGFPAKGVATVWAWGVGAGRACWWQQRQGVWAGFGL